MISEFKPVIIKFQPSSVYRNNTKSQK